MTGKYGDYGDYDEYYDSESQAALGLAAWEHARQESYLRRRFGDDPSKWRADDLGGPIGEAKEMKAFWGLVIAFLLIVLSALAFFAACMTIYHVMLPSFDWIMGQIGRLIGDGPAFFLGVCLWLSTLLACSINNKPSTAPFSGYSAEFWIFLLINLVAMHREMHGVSTGG